MIVFILALMGVVFLAAGSGYCAAMAEHHYRAAAWFTKIHDRALQIGELPSTALVIDMWHEAERTPPRGLAKILGFIFRGPRG